MFDEECFEMRAQARHKCQSYDGQRQRKAPQVHVPKRAPDPRLAITGEPTQTLVPLDKLHRKVEIKQPRPKREPLPVVTNEELQELAANNPPPPEWLEEASEFTPNQGR